MGELSKLQSLLIIVFLISLWGASIEKVWARERPGDMEAKIWMALSKEDRFLFVDGFLAGVSYSVRAFDYDLYSQGRELSRGELSDKVYQHLLRNPELRTGPIGPIIWDALKQDIVVMPRGLEKQEK